MPTVYRMGSTIRVIADDGAASTVPGPPGPADNTYTDLVTFKASDIGREAATLVDVPGVPDGRFFWETDNAPYTADDINVIKADSTSLAIGAWVRQRAIGVQDAAQSSLLAADSGAGLVGFKQSGTDSLTRTSLAKLRDTLSTDDKAGSTLKVQLDAVGTDLAAGGKVYLPRGQRVMGTTGFKFEGQRLNIQGDGRYASTLNFNPGAADLAAIEYNNPAAGGLYQGSVEGIGFNSGNATNKTAIRLVNCADVTVSNIGISTNAWQGSGSIGLEVYGRQSLHFHTAQIGCARPLVIRKNPAFPSINTDHFLLEHLELTTTEATGSAVFIDPDVMFTTCTMGPMALTGGKYGIYWSEAGSVGTSYGLVIDRLRREQAADATGYSVYLEGTTQGLQSLTIKNSYLVNTQHGVFLRRAQKVSIRDTTFAMNSSFKAIDMVFEAGSSLIIENCFFAGGTLNLTNAICVERIINDRGISEHYVYKANQASGAIGSDVYHGGVPVTMAADAVYEIAGATFSGAILVSTSEGVQAIYMLTGSGASTKEVSDWAGFFTIVKDASPSWNIYWDAGLARYVIQNKRGTTQTINVYRIGGTNGS